MILVELVARSGSAVEIHPRLTVAHGLTRAERSAVAAGVAALLQGRPTDVTAVAEVDGGRTALTQSLVRSLELGPAAHVAVLAVGDLPAGGPEARKGSANGSGPPAGGPAGPDIRRRLADLALRLEEAGEPVDTSAVESALARLAGARSAAVQRSSRGMDLAGRWAAYRRRLAELEAVPDSPPAAVDTALRTLERSEQALARARAEISALDQRLVHALEAAHRELVEAERHAVDQQDDQSERRQFWARAAEADALEALGFGSYDDYRRRLEGGLQKLVDDVAAALAEAREALAGDVAAPAALPAAGSALRAEGDAVRAEAVELLGGDPGDEALEDALRALAEPGADVDEALVELAVALEASGAGRPGPHVEAAAQAWLAAAGQVPVLRAQLEREMSRLGQSEAETGSEAAGRRPPPPAGAHRYGGEHTAPLPLELEVLLLARVAALAAAGPAGRLPLVVDDIVATVPDHAVERLLGVLERVSEIVQVVYLTGDDRLAAWASSLPPEQAWAARWRLPRPAPARRGG